MSIEIKEVRNAKDLKDFIRFPLHLYKNNPYYVPVLYNDDKQTLSKDKNAAFDYCDARYWLAFKDGKLSGRIAGICNRSFIEKWEKKYIRFGWFDFIDDRQVAAALLKEVEDWAMELGMEAVEGPLGFTDLDREGMLIEGFEEVATYATNYNYPYYPKILDSLGYQKEIDWIEFQVKVPEAVPDKVARMSKIILERFKLTVLKAKGKKDVLRYAEQIFDLINKAYSNLYGVVSLNQEQIQSYIRSYLSFVRTDFICIILNDKDQVVAFGITMPSLSEAMQKAKGRLFPFGFIHILKALRKNKIADQYIVAIDPQYQDKGLNAIIMTEIVNSYIKNGIEYGETNHELENNAKVHALWKYFEARQHKRRRCFIKKLHE